MELCVSLHSGALLEEYESSKQAMGGANLHSLTKEFVAVYQS
ncbi:hypothetical protein [Spirosoma daeguense]